MSPAALSRREFCEFIGVSNRELTTGYGHGPFRSRASSPISHAGGGSSACVSLSVSREPLTHGDDRELSTHGRGYKE